jgi:hypothetical protein
MAATKSATASPVHATLALAAATAMSAQQGMSAIDFEAWDAVCGVQEDEYDEPMTNRDVDPEHVAECDAWAEAHMDALDADGSPF